MTYTRKELTEAIRIAEKLAQAEMLLKHTKAAGGGFDRNDKNGILGALMGFLIAVKNDLIRTDLPEIAPQYKIPG